MKKKRDLGLLWFYIILMLSVLMVNPPILPFVNTYCAGTPYDLWIGRRCFVAGILVRRDVLVFYGVRFA